MNVGICSGELDATAQPVNGTAEIERTEARG